MEAQSFIKTGESFKADTILSNITKAKIAQSEWLYITKRKTESITHQLDQSSLNKLSINNDIYEDLETDGINFIKKQTSKLETSFKKEKFFDTQNRAKQLLVIYPGEINFHLYFGKSQLNLGKSNQAIKIFENAL